MIFRRNYDKIFDWQGLNQQLITHYADDKEVFIACMDASFIPKSGHCTAHLGSFWNGGKVMCKSEDLLDKMDLEHTYQAAEQEYPQLLLQII